MVTIKENSPFTPGNPVPIELFVGRVEQFKEIVRHVKQTEYGKQENVFLSGERGIGKSSLASYLRYYVEKEDFLAVHVFLGGVTTLEEFVRRIFEQILKEANKQTMFDKISGYFGKYIKQVDLFGISVSFNPPEADLKDLVINFPESIKNILDLIKDDKKGLFIILDDINGISNSPEFANWYKSFVDNVATHYTQFPLFLMPIGLPEIRDNLSRQQPSLMRIFRVIEIDKLSDKEVSEFIGKAFDKVNIEVEPESMDHMVLFSSGLPVLMHEIGDAVYWKNEDEIINQDDVMPGIIYAAERIGQKYLDPKVYRTIRSERYKSILRKLGEMPSSHFRKKDFESELNNEEKRTFDNFLTKMKQLGVIQSDIEGGRGAYKFVNELFPIYITMESRAQRRKLKE